MNPHALELLEYPKVRQMVALRCHSPRGRDGALALLPSPDRGLVEGELERVRQMRDLTVAGYDPGPIDVGEVSLLLARLSVDGDLLEPLEVLELSRLLSVSTRVRRALNRPEVEARYPRVHEIALRFDDFGKIVKRLEEVFDPAGEFLDTASPELARIRRRLRDSRAEAGSAMSALAQSITSRPEESFVTLREGRYVLAVRTQDRARIPGIVHGHSGSGQTVFLEPIPAVERNNAIAEYEAGEQQEKLEILRGLNRILRDVAPAIERAYGASADLDLLRARAQFALDLGATIPSFNEERRLRLHSARHPLLALGQGHGGAPVVPLDLEMEGERTTLVLSGPNMGGKTVALKTAGLLVVMAQSGLPVPAADGTDLPIVDNIFVDLGDEQSIEEETSTFAGHLRNLALAWTDSTPRSLVLLDELGGGTDPDEGAALGRGLLELLTERGCLILATTHLWAIKVVAHEHPGMANAAMEFDPATQRPTYHLQPGSPGRSRAFELARHLLPEGDELLSRAEGYRSRWAARVDEILADLDEKRNVMGHEVALLRRREQDLDQAIARRDQQAEKLRRRLHEIRQARWETAGRDLAEAESLLAESRRLRSETDRALRDKGESDRTSLDAQVRAVNERVATARRKMRRPTDPDLEPLVAADLRPGRRAYSEDLGGLVSIDSEPEGDRKVWVSRGSFRFLVPIESLFHARGESPQGTAGPSRSAVRGPDELPQVEREIDLRGRSAEEGLQAVERYVDRASIAGVLEIRIIHGKGKGILKREIEAFLKESPLVDSFRIGEPREGGWGATIVRIRSARVDL